MTDRELLELAAKAAGYEVVWNDHWACFQHKSPQPDRRGSVRHPWIPLGDDGDAFRLAVALRLLIGSTDSDEAWVQFYRNGNKPMGYATVEQPHNGDPCAATRRAIVLAAAELGKGMV